MVGMSRGIFIVSFIVLLIAFVLSLKILPQTEQVEVFLWVLFHVVLMVLSYFRLKNTGNNPLMILFYFVPIVGLWLLYGLLYKVENSKVIFFSERTI